jgi:hypothetical protein
MFVLRSAFWLTVAFLVMAPHGANLGGDLSALKDRAVSATVEAGENIVVSQILTSEPAARAVLATASLNTPSVDLPMQDSPTRPVPFPRPRPDWMG